LGADISGMQNEKNLYIIVFAVSVIGCGIMYFASNSGTSSDKAKVTFGQVDQLRKETQVKNNIERNKVQVENYKKAPALTNDYRAVDEQYGGANQGIVLESNLNHAAIDADEGRGQGGSFNMLETQINKRLVNDQRAAQMSQIQKRQFVEDYKARARAMGYLVELNDQMVVTRVTKIPDSEIAPKGPASVPVDVNVNEEEGFEEGEE